MAWGIYFNHRSAFSFIARWPFVPLQWKPPPLHCFTCRAQLRSLVVKPPPHTHISALWSVTEIMLICFHGYVAVRLVHRCGVSITVQVVHTSPFSSCDDAISFVFSHSHLKQTNKNEAWLWLDTKRSAAGKKKKWSTFHLFSTGPPTNCSCCSLNKICVQKYRPLCHPVAANYIVWPWLWLWVAQWVTLSK